ncbi:transmembrane protein 139 [Hyperolius riggenbachi]|uniref:transmembrane protein 139 n=1 Tax=Hyperolius riggenbachi TaxID=752182 RepID=UPI0035A3B675
MASSELRKGIHRTVVTLGMAFLLIGVVLLTVSDRVFILGICFLGAGSLAIISYLLVTVSTCVKKSRRMENVESPTEVDNRQSTPRQVDPDTGQFDVPRYEDVIQYDATIWTVRLGQELEPPPYHSSSSLASRRGTVPVNVIITNPMLLRVQSDIHEIKAAGFLPEERWPEPLTPPPTYNESMPQWEEDFEPPPQEEG